MVHVEQGAAEPPFKQSLARARHCVVDEPEQTAFFFILGVEVVGLDDLQVLQSLRVQYHVMLRSFLGVIVVVPGWVHDLINIKGNKLA